MIDYPMQESMASVDKLIEMRDLMLYGDPVGADLADDAINAAVLALMKSGLLDTMITRAALFYHPTR